jgi:carbonic anhydrase
MRPSHILRHQKDKHTARRSLTPVCEALEQRTLLNGSSSLTDSMAARALESSRLGERVDPIWRVDPATGTISGKIASATTGRPLGGVRVQLINANGSVAERTTTGPRGLYRFTITENGPYVVREITPPRWKQTSPTFVYTAPTGAYADGAGSDSWGYSTGNTDPSNGTVGVYGWHTIAPAGNLPFESPINITVPPINLNPYISVSFQPTTPGTIINNGHELKVQFSPSPANSINLGGTQFEVQQLHFHDPSEDQVDGTGYPMELHIVTKSTAGALTALVVFLELSTTPNTALQSILDAATTSPPPPSTSIDLNALLPSSMQGWFYQGSLTAPPLSQPINFVVFSTPITLTYSQLMQYETVAKASGFLPNARPIQPLDGRQVNEFNYDVNFQNQSVGALNFTLARRS